MYISVLTTGVPLGALAVDLTPEAALDVGQRIEPRRKDFPEQGDVGDGEAQGVDLGEALLVGERGHVHP